MRSYLLVKIIYLAMDLEAFGNHISMCLISCGTPQGQYINPNLFSLVTSHNLAFSILSCDSTRRHNIIYVRIPLEVVIVSALRNFQFIELIYKNFTLFLFTDNKSSNRVL